MEEKASVKRTRTEESSGLTATVIRDRVLASHEHTKEGIIVRRLLERCYHEIVSNFESEEPKGKCEFPGGDKIKFTVEVELTPEELPIAHYGNNWCYGIAITGLRERLRAYCENVSKRCDDKMTFGHDSRGVYGLSFLFWFVKNE